MITALKFKIMLAFEFTILINQFNLKLIDFIK